MPAARCNGRSSAWRAAGATAVCVLALAGCARPGGGGGPPQPGDTRVATINDRPIWASDVRREAAREGLISEGDPLDVSSPLFHQALDEVIDQKLLAAEADKNHLAKDPDAQRRIEAARERILGDLLIERLVERSVSDSAIRGLYDEQARLSAQVEQLHARQIVLSSQPDADQVRKQLAAGVAFEALAMQKSVDQTTRFNGGDLGYFTLDVMPPAYADALKTAKPGDIVGPFQSDAGWVVMKVEDRRTEPPISLDAARPQIVRFLTYDQVRELLEKLRRDNRIKLLIGPAARTPDAEPEPASAPPETAPASAAPYSASASPPVAAEKTP